MDIILAVDTSVEVHAHQAAEWERLGISTRRVDTMHEAIKILSDGEKFIFIAINEDTIPDFKTQLPIMRDAAETPIFVITSSYSIDKKVMAMSLGADVYDPFTAYIKDNVIAALEILKAQSRWANRTAELPTVLVCGDLIISRSRHKIFLRDKEIELTPKEFDVLYLLVQNQGYMFSSEQIYKEVWKLCYDESAKSVVWALIKRLRQKLQVDPQSPNYIKTMRDVGYSYDPESPIKD